MTLCPGRRRKREAAFQDFPSYLPVGGSGGAPVLAALGPVAPRGAAKGRTALPRLWLPPQTLSLFVVTSFSWGLPSSGFLGSSTPCSCPVTLLLLCLCSP